MTTFLEDCGECAAAPPSAGTTRPGILSRLFGRLATLAHNMRHREEIRRLADFTDEQLNDIGLKRDDLRAAMHLDLSHDPTTYLARQASSRRVKIRSRGQ